MEIFVSLLFISVSLLGAVERASSLSCLTQGGASVPFWAALKANHNASASPEGLSYGYVDSSTVSSFKSFSIESTLLSASTSPLFETLSQIYSSSSFAYILYNDEPVASASVSASGVLGHSKGVLAWGPSGGFWLIHSVPLFPPDPQSSPLSYPDSGTTYGQSFLCLTLSAAQIDDVGHQLQFNNPDVYAKSTPFDLSSFPQISAFFSGTRVNAAGSRVTTFSTGNFNFISFAKNAAWDQDIYAALVAPYWNTSLAVETWMRPLEPSYYPPQYPYETVNVAYVSIGKLFWQETQDHSKYAVSFNGTVPVVCIGGINRQQSQWTRGGETMCLQNINYWTGFTAAITVTDKH